jgi:hypothetical protein
MKPHVPDHTWELLEGAVARGPMNKPSYAALPGYGVRRLRVPMKWIPVVFAVALGAWLACATIMLYTRGIVDESPG